MSFGELKCINCGDELPCDCNNKLNLQFKNCRDCSLPFLPKNNNSICNVCKPFAIKKNIKNRRDKIKIKQKNGFCRHCPEISLKNNNSCLKCWFKQASRRSFGVTDKQWILYIRELLEKQNYKSALSGEDLIIGTNASLDRIVPGSKGGKYEKGNVRWISILENSMKLDQTDEEMFFHMKKILGNNKIIKKGTCIIGSDHNFFEASLHLKTFLESKGYEVIDISQSNKWRKVDYNEQAQLLSNIVSRNKNTFGILGCGTGQGMAIAANKCQDIRAALCYDVEFARKSKEHNNSNVLCLGSWKNSPQEMEEIIEAWLNEDFGFGRHVARVNSIENDNFYKHNVVLLPGVFDIFYPGFAELIKYGKKIGSTVIALNSDESVLKITGKKPQHSQEWRKKVLENIVGCDEVIINEDLTCEKLIKDLKVDYVLKGDNFTEKEVRKTDGVPKNIKVVLFPINQEYLKREKTT